MTITTDHPQSCYGIPVILDDDGNPLDEAPGLKAVRTRLGLSRAQVAAACAVSPRTVEAWEQGRYPVATEALLVLAAMLRRTR